MEVSANDQGLAFFGSLSYILVLIMVFLKRRNKGTTKVKEATYFKRNWLMFLIVIVMGQILCFVKEAVIQVYVVAKDTSEFWDIYCNTEQGISFFIGLFAVGILDKTFKIGNNYLNK